MATVADRLVRGPAARFPAGQRIPDFLFVDRGFLGPALDHRAQSLRVANEARRGVIWTTDPCDRPATPLPEHDPSNDGQRWSRYKPRFKPRPTPEPLPPHAEKPRPMPPAEDTIIVSCRKPQIDEEEMRRRVYAAIDALDPHPEMAEFRVFADTITRIASLADKPRSMVDEILQIVAEERGVLLHAAKEKP